MTLIVLLPDGIDLRTAKRFRRRCLKFLQTVFVWLCVVAHLLAGLPVDAATYYWDADGVASGNAPNGTGLGGSGIWNLTDAHWWDGTTLQLWPNALTDTALFTRPTTLDGLPVSSIVTLSSGVKAQSLAFLRSGYTLTGGDLTLGGLAPGVDVSIGETVTLESLLQGSAGFNVSGGGTVRLVNAANTYSGQTIVNNGTLAISQSGALGLETSNANSPIFLRSTTRGVGGGALRLDGGVVLTRRVVLEGTGPIGTGGAALVSVGNNSITGRVDNNGSSASVGLSSVGGRLTLRDIDIGGTSGSTLFTLGTTNGGGVGSYAITGAISGTGTLQKIGPGTLVLKPTTTEAFTGNVRLAGGSIRIDSAGAVGSGTFELNSGILELRSDSSFQFNNIAKQSSSSSVILVDRAVGGDGINQTIQIDQVTFQPTFSTFEIRGRNGYSVDVNRFVTTTDTPSSTNLIYNSLNGLLRIYSDFWDQSNNTASRTLTISGTGHTVVYGRLLGSSASTSFGHNLTKSESGTLTLVGVDSTLDGTVSVTGGTLEITDFRSINNNTADIKLGSGSQAGTLVIGTEASPSAAGLTTSKVIDIAGSSGDAVILANQTGSNPVVLNANFAGTGSATRKELYLGGNNSATNTINGVIANTTAGGIIDLYKQGSGVWQLAGSNTYTGNTRIVEGTLKIKANAPASTILGNATVLQFTNLGVTAGGVFEFIGSASGTTTESLGQLQASAGEGTVKLTSSGGFDAKLVFTGYSSSARAGLNFDTAGGGAGGTVTLSTSSNTNGILNPRIYYQGTNFAAVTGGIVGPAVTTTISTGSMTGGNANPYLITGTLSQNTAVILGGIVFQNFGRIDLNAGQTLTINNGANAPGGIIATSFFGQISGGLGITTGGSGDLVIRVDVNDRLEITTPILSTTTGGLAKNGPGTLVIGGVNQQTGATTVNSGTLEVQPGAVLSAAAQPLVLRQGTTLQLNGADTGTAISSFNGSGTIQNWGSGSATGTLVVGNGDGTGTFNGVMQDLFNALNVTKVGNGDQSWGGASTYTGVTTIGGRGTVTVAQFGDLGQPGGIGAGNLLDNAGSLVFNGSGDATTYGGLVFNTAEVVLTNRLFTLNGGPNGGARIEANGPFHIPVIFSNTGPIAFGANAAGNPQGLSLGGISLGDNKFFPLIADNGSAVTSVNKLEQSVWELRNPANSYSGDTTIYSSVLRGQSGSTLPTASNLVLNGGVFESTGVFSRSVGAGSNQFRFRAPDADTAAFRGGFSAGAAKLTVAWSGLPVWGATPHFLNARDGLVLSSNVALDELELAGNFSLGDAAVDNVPISANFSSGSTTITLASGNTSQLFVGQSIVGTGIPAGSYVFQVTDATTFVINNLPSATGTSASLTGSGSWRTIRVDDNVNAYTDFATVSGQITGSPGMGIRKIGTGDLSLLGTNTYSGITHHSNGMLIVNSLGNSATVAQGTSLGTSVGANLPDQALILGNAASGLTEFQYIGPGEVSDRLIRLNNANGADTFIYADGTGPLVLTNLRNDLFSDSKLLRLRGGNTQGNMISSVLTDFGGQLRVFVDGVGTWILAGDNTYTGQTVLTGASLGLGHDKALGTGTLQTQLGTLFAYNGPRTLDNSVSITTTSSAGVTGFIGEFDLTSNGNWTFSNTTAGHTLTNSIAAGNVLTLNGNLTFTTISGSTVLTLSGSGDTVINGTISVSSSLNVGLTYAGNGTLTLNGAGGNRNNGAFTVSSGRVILGADEYILHGSGKGGVVLNPAAGVTATLDLNGHNETINGLTANTAGNSVITNTAATPSRLTIGANNAAVSFGTGAGTYAITDSGSGLGTLSLTKTGTATTTIPSGVSLSYRGATAVDGGMLIVESPLIATSSLTVSNIGSVLSLKGGLTNPAGVNTVSVGDGAILSLVDNAATRITSLSSLTLGGPTFTTSTLLMFDVGDLNAAGDQLAGDLIAVASGGLLQLFANGQIDFDITDNGLNPLQTYTLVQAAGGGLTSGPLSPSSYHLRFAPGGFSSLTLTATDTSVFITTGTRVTSALYWTGANNSQWVTLANWSTNQAGTAPAAALPGASTDVIFQSDLVAGGSIVVSQISDAQVNSLRFIPSTLAGNTPTAINITSGLSFANKLEIAPQSPSAGITIEAGAAPSVTLSLPIRIGADQTWSVATGSSLIMLSSLLGDDDVTLSSGGRIALAAAADSTFNLSRTVDFTVQSATLELATSGTLGSTANSNPADIRVNGGALYASGSTTDLLYPLTLGGGTLSAATSSKTYSGAINITAASVINLRDSNSAALNTTSRDITLTNSLSGAGRITLDSINTVTAGNQITGSLNLSGDNSLWSGGLTITRGVVTASSPLALGTGPIVAEAGMLRFTPNAAFAYNVVNSITLNAPSGVFEILAGSTSFNSTVNILGKITLGGEAHVDNALRLTLANDFNTINLRGGIELGNDASISTMGGSTQIVTIDTVGISQTGGSRSLRLNDDRGGWDATNRTIAINAASTYTGSTSLFSGTLQLGHKDALGTGGLTIAGEATLQAGVDLSESGAGPLNISIVLRGPLTVAGNQSLTFSGGISLGSEDGTLTNSMTAGVLRFGAVGLDAILTVAGTGRTVIDELLSRGVTSTLISSISAGGSLTISDYVNIARPDSSGGPLTISGTGPVVINATIEDLATTIPGSILYNGTSDLTLAGPGQYAGGVTLVSGRLLIGNATAVGSGPLTIEGGTLAATIDISGSTVFSNSVVLHAPLQFNGTKHLVISGPVSSTGPATVSAGGTSGATLVLAGGTFVAGDLTLTGTGTGGILGGISQTGAGADLLVTGGTWSFYYQPLQVVDDLIVSGNGTVLNLLDTGVLPLSAGNYYYVRNGGTIRLRGNDPNGLGGPLAGVIVADQGSAQFDLAAYQMTVPRVDLGGDATGRTGSILGTAGVLSVTDQINLYQGSVAARLAGSGLVHKQFSLYEAVLSGDNSGLTGAAGTRIDGGQLTLDFSVNNAAKLNSIAPLQMRGGRLLFKGNDSANSVQSVASLDLSAGGANQINLVAASTQAATLNLGSIVRPTNSGVIHFVPNNAVSDVFTTSTPNFLGALGGWATISTPTGLMFARNDGTGRIVPVAVVEKNNVASWLPGEHISDVFVNEFAGFTGTLPNDLVIGSLRFNSPSFSTVTITNSEVLQIAGGGILATDSTGSPYMTGGFVSSGTGELIVSVAGGLGLRFGSAIIGTTSITKWGDGQLILQGRNTQTGPINLRAGGLWVSGNQIGDDSSVTFADNSATSLRSDSNETIGTLSGGRADATTAYGVLSVGGGVFTVNQYESATFAGKLNVFSSAASFVKKVAGTNLTLTGNTDDFRGTMRVDAGAVILAGPYGRLTSVFGPSIRVNHGGAFLIDNNDDASPNDRLPDNITINLHSADGALAGETAIRGFAMRTDNAVAEDETVGVFTFASGANYLAAETTDAAGSSALVVNNFVRTNNATADVRGTDLGQASGRRAQFRIGNSGNQSAFAATLVGGGGAAGTRNISIVHWAIGESFTVLGPTATGNSLVTYVPNAGFRPLNLATEYAAFAAQLSATDNIREVITGNLAAPAVTVVNALVLHADRLTPGDVGLAGSGAGSSLTLTSGALLITLNPSAAAGDFRVNLSGFDSGIQAGPTGEYVIHVVNPSSAPGSSTLTAILTSPLTSLADLTKSGPGTLVLTGGATGTAGGGSNKTVLNEGVLQIDSLANIGGATGPLVFAGGTLLVAASFVDDLSLRTIVYQPGGGTLNTNGRNLAFAASAGSGTGGLTKIGAGSLTLGAAATYSGPTVLAAGSIVIGANNALGTGDLTIQGGTTLDLAGRSVLQTNFVTTGSSPTVAGTGTVTVSGDYNFRHTGNTSIAAVLAGNARLTKSELGNLTLTGLNTFREAVEVQAGTLTFNSVANVNAGASSLGNPSDAHEGVVRLGLGAVAATLNYVGTGHATNRILGLQGDTAGAVINALGTGAITYGGAKALLSGEKTLTLGGTSGAAVRNSIGLIEDAAGVISLAKSDANTWVLTAANSYSGTTTINQGTLTVNGSILASSSITVGGTNQATLNGNGAVQGPLVVASTGTISAGASSTAGVNGDGVGRLTVASSTVAWQDGATLVFDFADAVGDNSTFDDWDYFQAVSANLSLGTGLKLTVRSWTPDLANYGAATFDPAKQAVGNVAGHEYSYQWLWGSFATIDQSGDLSDRFSLVDASQVFSTGSYTGGGSAGGFATAGTFWVSSNSGNLYLNYSAVPEPGGLSLIAMAASAWAVLRQRKKKRTDSCQPNGRAIL
ncbi:MAG: hypothetical protein C0483_21615 [Pirellula sp.]|nr:hypothetical protein [Pirellula sp.]